MPNDNDADASAKAANFVEDSAAPLAEALIAITEPDMVKPAVDARKAQMLGEDWRIVNPFPRT